MSDADVPRRLSNLEEQHSTLKDRVSAIETGQAVNAERYNHIDGRLGKIEQSLTWLLRIVIGGIVVAVVGFLIRGGFNAGL